MTQCSETNLHSGVKVPSSWYKFLWTVVHTLRLESIEEEEKTAFNQMLCLTCTPLLQCSEVRMRPGR